MAGDPREVRDDYPPHRYCLLVTRPANAAPADRIVLRGLRAHGWHGVLDAERQTGQPFGVDLELELDTRAAAASDDLADTVDYSAVARAAVGVLTGEPVALVETLAERVAGVVLADRRVEAVTVTVHKPHAPLDVVFDDVAVVVRRSRVVPQPSAGGAS